ncbi:alpha beta hydrolase, partial [Moniliophthora roreri]
MIGSASFPLIPPPRDPFS